MNTPRLTDNTDYEKKWDIMALLNTFSRDHANTLKTSQHGTQNFLFTVIWNLASICLQYFHNRMTGDSLVNIVT